MKVKKLFNLPKRHRRALRANHFMLESLEPRLLLSATPMTAAVVTTDHLDYAPGETAVITTSNQTGEGLQFSAGELVRFQVTRTDGIADNSAQAANVGPSGNAPWYVVDGVGGFAAHQEFNANGQIIDRDGNGQADWIAPDNDLTVNGSISTTWYVEEQYRNSSLLVTAAGQESGAVATQAFTDAVGANSAPSGADQTITLTENTPYTFSTTDFGFTDPNDSPANDFQAVTITAVPVSGTLTLNGTPVQAGDSITIPQAGATWTARESNRGWDAIASSADGTQLVAAVWNGQLYTSTDAGTTWTARESNRGWQAVASSADGTKLVAAVWSGQLYTSTDAGVTWTARENSRGWVSVASSADGTKLVAATHGQLYTSTDAGVTWTARENIRVWQAVASSADGTKLVAAVWSGQLYTSTDAGVTWTAQESIRQLRSPARSTHRMTLLASADRGRSYTSTDAGVTWTARENIRGWYAVASSADGTKLLAADAAGYTAGQLYTSMDAGVTWTARESTRQWLAVASSADGTKLVAGAYGGQLYTSVSQSLGLVYTPAANASGTSLASISFQVQDSGGTAHGGVDLDQTANTITFNVTPVYVAVNSAPSGADQTITITENEPYTFSVADFGFTDPNDSPANDFQAVTITAVPVDGTLTLNGTPVQAGDSIALPQAGVAWTARENNRTWTNLASSADGMKLVAGAYGGQLYTSTDAGMTWTARESVRQWYAVASSADGMQLVAGTTEGHLYTSTDAGVTWTARESARQWTSIASSADGMKLVAAALYRQGSEHLYTSTDAGVTWTARENTRNWTNVASSADGMKLIAGTESGQLYTSTDAGVTWSAREDIRGWVSVASSADGMKLVAGAYGGQLYISTDAGVTWTAHESSQQWHTVASSADGTKLVAGATFGQLYTSVPQPLALVYTPAANASGTSLASISFQVQDSGGTTHGGVNLDQTANTITFNVTPVYHANITTTTVDSSAATSTYGDLVTFTAVITPASGSAAPTGAVEFFDGTTSLGSSNIASNGTGLDSIFTLSISTLNAGTHAIHAVYTATDTFVHSTSSNITQTVNKANAVVTGYSGVYDAAAHGFSAVGVLGESLSGLVMSVPTHTDAGIYLDTFTFTDVTGNYHNVVNGSVISNIAKADAVVTVDGYTGVYDGVAHGATGTVVGVLGDLSAAGTSLDLGSSFTNAPGGTAYWTFNGGTNYHDQHGSVVIVVNAKAISYIIGNASHVFGSTADLATVLGTTFLTGVNGENLGISYNSTGNTVASLVGSYAVHGSVSDGTGMLSNYDVTTNPGTLTVTTPNVITIVQDGVNLIIVGTDSRDTIRVNATNPNSITINRETHDGEEDDTIIGGEEEEDFCDVGNATLTYSVGVGGHVIVYGMAGRDKIRLTGTVNLEAHGGEGNDTITGGAGNDVIFGDLGNDTLTGNAGNDVLVGGSGSDRLVGSAGHDLLISGELMGDHNGGAYDYAALRAIDDSWAASWSVDSDLESTSGDVLDESGSADRLTGSSGHDWFILGSTDKITDIKSTTKDGDKITY